MGIYNDEAIAPNMHHQVPQMIHMYEGLLPICVTKFVGQMGGTVV